jgi:hypothetical protein
MLLQMGRKGKIRHDFEDFVVAYILGKNGKRQPESRLPFNIMLSYQAWIPAFAEPALMKMGE